MPAVALATDLEYRQVLGPSRSRSRSRSLSPFPSLCRRRQRLPRPVLHPLSVSSPSSHGPTGGAPLSPHPMTLHHDPSRCAAPPPPRGDGACDSIRRGAASRSSSGASGIVGVTAFDQNSVRTRPARRSRRRPVVSGRSSNQTAVRHPLRGARGVVPRFRGDLPPSRRVARVCTRRGGTSLAAMVVPAVAGALTHARQGHVVAAAAAPLALGSFAGERASESERAARDRSSDRSSPVCPSISPQQHHGLAPIVVRVAIACYARQGRGSAVSSGRAICPRGRSTPSSAWSCSCSAPAQSAVRCSRGAPPPARPPSSRHRAPPSRLREQEDK